MKIFYLCVGEELVPRRPVQHAADAVGRDGRAVAEDFNADDEIAEDGQGAEGVDHFAVGAKACIDDLKSDDTVDKDNNKKHFNNWTSALRTEGLAASSGILKYLCPERRK